MKKWVLCKPRQVAVNKTLHGVTRRVLDSIHLTADGGFKPFLFYFKYVFTAAALHHLESTRLWASAEMW